MTYAQQSIIGSGGYMPEDVRDVQEIMASGKWELERIITHEFPLNELEQAIRTASDVDHAGNVVVEMKDKKVCVMTSSFNLGHFNQLMQHPV